MFESYGPSRSQTPQGKEIGCALPWMTELTLQSVELNTDHRALLKKLNSLLSALGCSDLDRINLALTALTAEAEAHFVTERELMLAVDYPDRAVHFEKHEELLRGIEHIGFALSTGLIPWSPAETRDSLRRWFVPHLTRDDRRLADFIAARGPRDA